MTDDDTPAHSRTMSPGMTRDCTDPWEYIEFRVNGDIGPCCVRVAGNLATHSLSQILNGPPIRDLRSSLLRGAPDRICRDCGLRGEITPEQLRGKVETLLHAFSPPEDFEPLSYLAANPGVAAAGVDALAHFREHGRFEGRPLRPPT